MAPVNPSAIYSRFNLKKATVKYINFLNFLISVKMGELTDITRQRGDTRLGTRAGDVDDAVEYLLRSRLAVQKEISYTINTLNLFAENAPADAQNKFMIDQLNTECVLIKAADKFPINLVFSETGFEFIKYVKFSVAGNLAYSLERRV